MPSEMMWIQFNNLKKSCSFSSMLASGSSSRGGPCLHAGWLLAKDKLLRAGKPILEVFSDKKLGGLTL